MKAGWNSRPGHYFSVSWLLFIEEGKMIKITVLFAFVSPE